jgi:hypothetical protein
VRLAHPGAEADFEIARFGKIRVVSLQKQSLPSFFANVRNRVHLSAKDTIMLLVITPSAKARGCAQAIQQVTSEETHVVATASQALAQLRAREYVAVLIDQAFLETEPVESDMVMQHIGTAVPVHVNFAINNMGRVIGELRGALHRHQKEVQLIRREVQQGFRNELKGTVTALLLSSEMALQAPDLQPEAKDRMRVVHELAHEIRLKLEGPI